MQANLMIRSRRSWFRRLGAGFSLFMVGSLFFFLLPSTAVKADAVAFPILPDNVLSTFSYKEFNVVQTSSPNLQVVSVTGQPFTTALEATTPATVTLPQDDSAAYAVTMQTPITQAVVKNDVLDATFWLKQVSASSGQAQTTFNFERIGGDYAKSFSRTIYPGTDWIKYHYTFRSVDNFAAGAAQVSFWLGYNPPQTISLAGLTINDLGPDAYVPPPTYEGRDPNAPWRAAAAQRIDEYRKGDLNVTVRDQAGNLIPDAAVHVQMLNHDFRFGTAVDNYRITDNSSNTDNATYRANLTQLFNTAVTENALKWGPWEDPNAQITTALPTVKWLHDNGLDVRGHNLIWPVPYVSPQPDIPALLQNPAALSNRIDNHIQNEVATLRGQISDWDVVNELYAGPTWPKVLGGNAAIAHWFQVAQQADPNVQLALNDDPFFQSDGSPNTGRLTFYKNLIADLKAMHAPIQRLGIESHFSPDSLPSPDNVVNVLDQVAAMGVTPQITEFDLSTTDNQLQADFTRDYLTAVFSDPNVDTFIMWGFWNGDVWQPNTGLFNQDWSLKPNGQIWQDLVYKQWWTDVNGTTDSKGHYSTRGFLGDYKVDVTVNGKTNTYNTSLAHAGKYLNVTFDPNATPPPTPISKPLPPPATVPTPFVPDRGSQLLTNGDIENATSNWYCFGGCPLAQEQSTVHGGGNAMLVSNRQAFWQGPAQNLISSVQNGATYKSNVWVRLAPGSAPTELDANFKIVSDASPDGQTVSAGSAQVTADAWTQLSATAQLNWTGKLTDAEWWISSPYGVPAADFYVDDATIQAPPGTRTVVSRDVTTVDGKIDGSLQQLNASDITLNSGAVITQGLYVPGEPLMHPNGKAVASLELPSGGASNPTDKLITLNQGSQNPFLLSQTDPLTLTTVAAPATPQGTHDVVLDHPGQTAADFSTLRNLTMKGNLGDIVVPAGSYGSITTNTGSNLMLGVAGATSPAVYNLQSLTLNGTSQLNVVGPVVLNLANGLTVKGSVGSARHPLWLTLNIAHSDLTVNDHATVNALINIPGGGVIINRNASVYGRIITNHLTLNKGGLITDPAIVK